MEAEEPYETRQQQNVNGFRIEHVCTLRAWKAAKPRRWGATTWPPLYDASDVVLELDDPGCPACPEPTTQEATRP